MPAKQTILVVDDEPKLCQILQKVLTQGGYEVLTETSGEAALCVFKKKPVHLILLDLKMPGMDGLEVLKKVREEKQGTSVPVVIMTAYGSASSAREALSLGAVDYLAKPFDLRELKSIVSANVGPPPKEEGKERLLVYIPILHTQNDMGSMADVMQEKYIKQFGKRKWQEHVEEIDKMWKEIRRKILRLKLSYKMVKIYQDGLPICDKEKEIIVELASRGSPNHKLVQWMMRQGAALVGTEAPELLMKEYNYLKQSLACEKYEEREKLIHEFEKESKELLRDRDKRIAEQIDATLKQGETAVLFIGLLHQVDELLPTDMKVHYLIHRLPFRRSFEANEGKRG